jgi:hypothetical protein
MKLVRLVYVSRLSPECHLDDLAEIAAVSRRNNLDKGITGCLCYSLRGFLQALEGAAVFVNELYRRVVRDTRHGDVTLLEYRPVASREFERWSMAYVRSDEVDASLLRKYTTGATFDPFEMSPDQAVAFMKALAAERTQFLQRQQDAARESVRS